jgi:hypothetical protein
MPDQSEANDPSMAIPSTRITPELAPASRDNPEAQATTGELAVAFQELDRMDMSTEAVIHPIETELLPP